MRPLRLATVLILSALATQQAFALQPRGTAARFDHLARTEAGSAIGRSGLPVAALPAGDPLREAWERFGRENGGWSSWIDVRSGLPARAIGSAIRWVPAGAAVTMDTLEAQARAFLDTHRVLLGAWDGQLALDRAASAQLTDDVWQLTFRQVVNGVPVDDARFDFHVSRGGLVAFGATGFAPVTRPTAATLDVAAARAALDAYLGTREAVGAIDREPPSLHLVPVDPQGGAAQAWGGARGAGYAHALVWRFTFGVPGEAPTWVATVDANTGTVRSLFDNTQYEQVKGGIYPVSDDGFCPTGCEQPGFPMPFADYSVNGGAAQTAGDMGMYTCGTLGQSVVTHLAGPYVRVNTSCGAVNETTTCDNPLDLAQGPGTDCTVPAGATSAGDTHSARSSFYHLNRVMEKGRAWLPANTWLQSQLTDNLDIFSTCNAFWDGASVNFYRSGGGCRNTGEIAGVFVHEWGHGIDNNDGGGYDNPSEAYADTVAFFETRESCIGRGFWADNHNCSGYGDTCTNCSGIRDQDWDKHVSHTPANAAWVNSHCGGGSGPCGKETHCESYISSEAIWDLAVRDLPASGLDTASSWQLAEKLWYKSRNGSGGNAYNCSGSTSDGCGAAAWHHKFLLIDDDDANLANGTPHAAAIFAAFNRHGIACGAAGDAANQNSSACPTLAKPVVSASAGSGAVQLFWAAVPNAANYRILRNDLGCDRAQIIIDNAAAPATSYNDADVPNGFTLYYRVQAVAANAACDSPVSDCVSSAAQPFAGSVHFDARLYSCAASMTVQVVDGNVGADTLPVTVWSNTESAPETVVLTAIAPGANKYLGTLVTTGAAPVHGDGKVSVTSGDAITVQYVDANDGQGHSNVAVTDVATADCVAPVITAVHDQSVTDTAASVVWTTDEASDTVLRWGSTRPPQTTNTGAAGVTTHQVNLTGLTACTIYWYEVRSTDTAGNLAASTNGGQYFHFETLGNFGQGLQPCHAGRVSLDRAIYACGSDSVKVQLVDLDMNASPTTVDTAFVQVTSSTETAPETVLLTETGANTSTFTGTILTTAAAAAADGKISVHNGDVVTATYHDLNDGAGAAATSFATGHLDCGGPAITGIDVDTITDARATIHFTTDEPATTVVEWGPTPALGQTLSNAALVTTHALTLNQAATCQDVYFRVLAADTYGNTTMADRAGAPFSYHTATIPGLYWKDSFENGTATWTLQGEWESGAPQGKGGSSGTPDPTSAYNNAKVLGTDLTGLGSYPGDYEPGVNIGARTPIMNASAWQHTKLMFARKLQTGPGDSAEIFIYGVGGQKLLWRGAGVYDAQWQVMTYDVSAVIDGAANAAVEFREHADGSGQYSGWNIDDVVLKNGSLPNYGACGGCTTGPSFAGAASALDNDPCGASGVTISWAHAPSWGSGAEGSYAVYRGTAAGFPADAAHLVASGITGLSYVDATAPAGQFYYLVKAENAETCGSGPANGGVLDGNAVYQPVLKTSNRPLPGAVDSLHVTTVAGTHVRLTWSAPSGAAGYHVYRALDPHPGNFGLLAQPAATTLDDLGAAANLERYYYLVRAYNACGSEGP